VTHYRQRLRERVVELLKAADIPGINERVYGSVFFAVRTLPLISVYVEAEQLVKESGMYDRALRVVVKVFVSAGEFAENDCDDYCAAIEAGLDLELGGMANNGGLTEVRFERSSEGSQEYMTAELAYEFRYATAYHNPMISTH